MTKEFKFPDVGEGITEGEIVKWKIKEGDTIKEHDIIAEVETDKAIVEIPSPLGGKVLRLNHKEGDTIKVGETILIIGNKEETISNKLPTINKPTGKQEGVGAVGELEEATEITKRNQIIEKHKKLSIINALPVVRRLARDIKVDISKIKGTGHNSRITEEDVRKYSKINPKEKSDIKIERRYDMWGYIKKIPLKGIRKAIANNMVKSIYTAPHVTHMDEIDVTNLYMIKQREKRIAESKNIKLTYLPFIMKACVNSLKKYPEVNSSLDDEHEEIILKKYYNIGIAVDTENGLMVPVIKGVDQKNIFKLSKEIQELATKARERKIDIADMKGGTFTITNVGSIGGIFATPIINYPEVAILATGRIHDRLTIDSEKKIKIRKILPISLSFDHRIVDGANAAKFVNRLKELLEDPDLLLMES